MEHRDSFKSIQSKFQQERGENTGARPITYPRPGAKPVIPAKPNIQLANDHFFQKPVPKAISSPELANSPKSDPFKNARNHLQSHQSFSFRSNSASHQEASLKRPSLPVIKPLPVPKPSVNISHYTNTANIHANAVTTTKAKFEKSSPPRLKILPSETVLGLKPRKPARPPIVDLEKFARSDIDSGDYVTMKSFAVPHQRQARLTASQSQPNLTTCYSSRNIRSSLREKQEIYEDVTDFSSFKKSKSTSLQHVVISETSGQDDLYDDAELILEKSKPPVPPVKKKSCPVEQDILITNWRNETNLKKNKKQEQEFRKRFQFHGEIKVLTRMMVDPNAKVQKPGHKDLTYTRGEILDVIQLTDANKILCRNCEGKFGYVPRKALLNLEKNLNRNVSFDDVYDDTELISNTFPAMPAKAKFQSGYTTRLFERNPRQISKPEVPKRENLKIMNTEDRELKEMRKKFKFEGEIRVLTRMMVVPSAGNKRGGGKDLPISKGEIFEVIQFTNQDKILCRNSKGKYGYVKRRYVLQLFDELLSLLSSHLERENTSFRRSIPPTERLIITLRYLATGHSFASLHFQFLVGKTTASNIVHDTCRAIWNVLSNLVLKKPTTEDWCKIAEVFWDRCNFPNCVGAIDGKHIRIVKPIGSGSKFYNYKKYFSFVLLAVADANYCFTYVDIGSYGSSSDSSIFARSSFGRMLRENRLNLPPDCPLPGTNGPPLPFAFVGDEAFALSEHLLRPYSNRSLNVDKRVFNYRLTRARRVVECAFGILANKWRFLHSAINLKMENAISAVKAACVLHNFVALRDGYNHEDSLMHDMEGARWSASRGTSNGATVREEFTSFFMSAAGSVPWQQDAIA